MIRTQPGVFRTNANGRNCVDIVVNTLGSAYQAYRSSGATLIDRVSISPTTHQTWKLQSLAVQAYLDVSISFSSLYGRLGKVIIGIPPTNQQLFTTNPSAGGPSQPLIALPADPSLTATLWDPEVDAAPPSNGGGAGPTNNSPLNVFLPVSAILQLPQSIELNSGEEIAIGIWMLPSIMGFQTAAGSNWLFEVFRASYALTYDDGE